MNRFNHCKKLWVIFLPPAYEVRREVIFSHESVRSPHGLLSSGPWSFCGGTPTLWSLVPGPFWGYTLVSGSWSFPVGIPSQACYPLDRTGVAPLTGYWGPPDKTGSSPIGQVIDIIRTGQGYAPRVQDFLVRLHYARGLSLLIQSRLGVLQTLGLMHELPQMSWKWGYTCDMTPQVSW